MPDPHLFGWPADSTRYRVQTVFCPHKATSATIVAATWTMCDSRWTTWSIVDCSLMPAGCIFCDVRCLAQLEMAEAAGGRA